LKEVGIYVQNSEELEKEWVRRYEEEYLGWGMRVNSDSKPQQFVVSEPPSGYRKITNIYYNIELGEVEYEG